MDWKELESRAAEAGEAMVARTGTFARAGDESSSVLFAKAAAKHFAAAADHARTGAAVLAERERCAKATREEAEGCEVGGEGHDLAARILRAIEGA